MGDGSRGRSGENLVEGSGWSFYFQVSDISKNGIAEVATDAIH
jgi:hypothetical protein